MYVHSVNVMLPLAPRQSYHSVQTAVSFRVRYPRIVAARTCEDGMFVVIPVRQRLHVAVNGIDCLQDLEGCRATRCGRRDWVTRVAARFGLVWSNFSLTLGKKRASS